MNFLKTYRWLLPMLLFTGALLIGRMVHSRSFQFMFIPWNLFLALVPLVFSYKLSKSTSKMAQCIYLCLWLLFFPNSMYIVTDLFHLKVRPHVPQWYDLLILFTAAINGLIMGFLSLRDVEQHLHPKINRRYLPVILLSLFCLCGYGIYLGRYLRWNSWDIVTDPLSLLWDVKDDVFHPFRNIQAWMLSSLFGIWLYIMYVYFKRVKTSI
jgi:uncharacterized membrane protein